MRAHVLLEPELEFGGASRDIDPRFAISTFGPADLGTSEQPNAMRLGLIGPDPDVEALQSLARAMPRRDPREGRALLAPVPIVPGCDVDRGLGSTVVFSDRATNTISPTTFRQIERARGAAALDRAVEAYCDEARALAESNRVDVIVLAHPTGLKDLAVPPAGDRELDEDADEDLSADVTMRFANFHDLVKARLLATGTPVQIGRRGTFDESVARPPGSSPQDEATRAWNLHVAFNGVCLQIEHEQRSKYCDVHTGRRVRVLRPMGRPPWLRASAARGLRLFRRREFQGDRACSVCAIVTRL